MKTDNVTLTKLLLTRIKILVSHINTFSNKNFNNGLDNWLDSQEVCQILNISPRTLQFYRDNGKLPYTRIEKKMYYRPEDVNDLLNKNR